ncbi:hypothetical protein RB653_006591 [Dictyostelium firmibasis]|uniref:Uncharacterized protein n=1 Tax=Dictyostelium firmibasis TaxID=79012 RepID=A0AAN7TU64_9MYCE
MKRKYNLGYTIKNLFYFIDEITQLSLVSKKWFNNISNLISNNIKQPIQSISDNSLKYFYFSNKSGKNNFKLKINGLFSIIKINIENQNQNKQQQKILNQCNLFKIINDNEEQENNLPDEENYLKNIEINKLTMVGTSETNPNALEIIEKIKPLQIKYNPNGNDYQDAYCHMNYSSLFNPSMNPRIELIKIERTDHVEPSHMLNINKLENLHTLSCSVLFHDIIRAESGNYSSISHNGCNHFGGLNENTILNARNHWETMINSIKTSKQLKNITIKNFCFRGPHCMYDGIGVGDTSIRKTMGEISNGIKMLLEGPPKLHYLKFTNIDFTEFSSTYSTLITNKTLKTLIFKSKGRSLDNLVDDSIISPLLDQLTDYYISTVFSLNTTIRHFKFTILGFVSSIFNPLLKNYDKLSLYSIELEINECQFDDCLKYIKRLEQLSKNSHSTLKQFTLTLTEQYFNRKSYFQKKILNYFNNYQNADKNIIVFLRFDK